MKSIHPFAIMEPTIRIFFVRCQWLTISWNLVVNVGLRLCVIQICNLQIMSIFLDFLLSAFVILNVRNSFYGCKSIFSSNCYWKCGCKCMIFFHAWRFPIKNNRKGILKVWKTYQKVFRLKNNLVGQNQILNENILCPKIFYLTWYLIHFN
jgi:hypothetical protein